MKLLTLLLACVMLSGCFQRIAEYDPTTGALRYKSNSFATKSHADRVKVTFPSGLVIEIDKAEQDNDSIKASAIISGVPVKIESGE